MVKMLNVFDVTHHDVVDIMVLTSIVVYLRTIDVLAIKNIIIAFFFIFSEIINSHHVHECRNINVTS